MICRYIHQLAAGVPFGAIGIANPRLRGNGKSRSTPTCRPEPTGKRSGGRESWWERYCWEIWGKPPGWNSRSAREPPTGL